ncbi:hypothetical protein N494_10945 [Clostridium botulinum A2B7 92]|nr:hypothetical protein N494_10945 [Clostridium botulinum A2B7 92]
MYFGIKKNIKIGYLSQNSFYKERTLEGGDINSNNKDNIQDFFKISSHLGIKKEILEYSLIKIASRVR